MVTLLLVTRLFAALGAQEASGIESDRLVIRVLSYNIHHGRGMDGIVDLARVASVIRATGADLVALQEVDERVRRSGQVSQTDTLATMVGMEGVFFKQIEYDGGLYGQAILSRHRVAEQQTVWLPGNPERERRILGLVTIDMAKTTIGFATTHWHHADPRTRLAQSVATHNAISALAYPVILAGDFNAEPSSAPLEELRREWLISERRISLATYPADQPTKQIDYVCLWPRAAGRLLSVHVIDEPTASDHRPILAEFEIHPTVPSD